MSYLVDSDYLVDVLAGVPSAVELVERLATNGVGVSIVSYGEIYEGAFSDLDPAPRLARMRDFLSGFALFSLTDPIMEGFARLRTSFRCNGTLIPDMDLLIAATALHHDLMLVTRNTRHFGRIPELRIYRAD